MELLLEPPSDRVADVATGLTVQPPPGVRRSRTYFPELESLRGLAILIVVAYHMDRAVVWPGSWAGTRPALPLAYLRAGHTGVTLFFVLSGFLLALPFLHPSGPRPPLVRDYFRRRALRILPLYWTAVVLGTVLSARRVADLWRGIPYLVFLNAAYGWFTPIEPYSTVWWSLVTEVEFYLALPLLAVALRTPRGRWIALGAFAAAYAAFLTGRLRMASIGGQVHLIVSAFGFGPVFLSGIAAAAVYRRYGEQVRDRLSGSAWWRNGAADVVLVGILAVLGLVLQWAAMQGWDRTSAPPRTIWHAAEAGLWSAMILVLLVAPCRLKPVFCNPLLGALGVLSYSIYLFHFPLMSATIEGIRAARPLALHGWTAPTVVVMAAVGGVTIAASALTWRLIERPFLVRKAQLDD